MTIETILEDGPLFPKDDPNEPDFEAFFDEGAQRFFFRCVCGNVQADRFVAYRECKKCRRTRHYKCVPVPDASLAA